MFLNPTKIWVQLSQKMWNSRYCSQINHVLPAKPCNNSVFQNWDSLLLTITTLFNKPNESSWSYCNWMSSLPVTPAPDKRKFTSPLQFETVDCLGQNPSSFYSLVSVMTILTSLYETIINAINTESKPVCQYQNTT